MFLRSLRNNIADVVFIDPPFNLGKTYGRRSPKKDRLSDTDYLAYMTQVLTRSCEILRPGGSLFLYHIPKWALLFSRSLDLHLRFRHWIAISMKNGFPAPGRLYPAHYALLHYTKGTPASFVRPKIPPATCPHCKQEIRDYGGYRKFMTDGVNLSDVWDDLSPVRHKKYKTRSANELPIEIPRRAMQMSGRQRGVLVDPFGGSGSTLLAASEYGMRYIGCDIEASFARLMASRLRVAKRRNSPER